MTKAIVEKMIGRGETFHEETEKRVRKLHSDKCSCDRCKMHRDKYSRNQYMNVAGTPVSLERP